MATDNENPWIEWTGGEQPVSDDTRVETETRGFGILPACYADSVDWKHRPIGRLDVIAYRAVKVNITGALRGAIRSIDPDKDEAAYAFLLEEIVGHIEDVRAGRHTLEEFADFYCMAPQVSA